MQTTCAVSHCACMNKHSLSGLCGGVPLGTSQAKHIQDERKGVGYHKSTGCAMSWMKRRWWGGSEVVPDIQVTLPALNLSILYILFIIDKAPLSHSPNPVLVIVRASLSAALHPLAVRPHTLRCVVLFSSDVSRYLNIMEFCLDDITSSQLWIDKQCHRVVLISSHITEHEHLSSDIDILRNVFIVWRINKARTIFSNVDESQLDQGEKQPRKKKIL